MSTPLRRRPSFAEEEGFQRARNHRDHFIKTLEESEAFKPLVLVIASKGARAVAAGNGGLAIEDLLQPFATIQGSIPIRNKDRSYNLKQFGVRFVAVENLMPGTEKSAQKFDEDVAKLVRANLPGESSGMSPKEAAIACTSELQIHSPRGISKFLKKSASTSVSRKHRFGELSPWWSEAVREVADVGLRGQQWDMFCHPILLLHVVSTSEPAGEKDPASQAASMLEPHNLPHVMTSGQYNRNVPSMVLIVHDNVAAASIDPNTVKREVCNKTGMHAEAIKLVRVNSLLPDDHNEEHPDLWTPCMSWSAQLAAKQFIDEVSPTTPQPGTATKSIRLNWSRPGGLISPDDLIGIQKFVTELVESTIVRQLESRIFSLSNSVAKSRQGFMNAFKSWRRKAKDLNTRKGLMYESASIESQIRLLADLLFMTRDYESAMSYYKMVRDDYKSDRALLHYASTAMMIAVCAFCRGHRGQNGTGTESLANVAGKEVEQNIELALTALIHMDSNSDQIIKWASSEHHTWLTARLTMVLAAQTADIYRAAPFGGVQSLDMATKILLASSWRENTYKPSVFSALLQEQASICSLLVPIQSRDGTTVKLRRAAHQMVRAGMMYEANNFPSHALNCYGIMTPVYDNHWALPDTYVCHSTAAHLYDMGAIKEAQRCMLDLLSMKRANSQGSNLLVCGLSKATQSSILADMFLFFNTTTITTNNNDGSANAGASGAGGIDNPLDLSFPGFNDEFICTMVNENPSSKSGEEALGWSHVPTPKNRDAIDHQHTHSWSKMQRAASRCRRGWTSMSPSMGNVDNSQEQLDYVSKKERAADLKRPPQWCSINEPIEVSLHISNPFALPLVLKNVKLIAEIESESKGVSEEKSSSSSQVKAILVDSLTLEENSRQRLHLRIVPLSVGILHVKGVRWELADTHSDNKGTTPKTIHCVHKFQLRGTPMNDSRKNRAIGARLADTRLMISVVGPRPWIGASVEYSAGAQIAVDGKGSRRYVALPGQLLEVKLKLKNFGGDTAKYISLVCSRPGLVAPQNASIVGATSDTSLFILTDTAPLEAGEEKEISLLVRAPAIQGLENVYLMIEYSSEASIPTDIGQRALSLKKILRRTRFALSMQVVSSLSVNSFLRPHFSNSGEYILGVIISYGSTEKAGSIAYSELPPIRLVDLASMSERYKLSPYEDSSGSGQADSKHKSSMILQGGEKTMLYFSVKASESALSNIDDRINVCSRLLPKAKGASESSHGFTLTSLGEETSSLRKLICMAHINPMYDAIFEEEKKRKMLEMELLGQTEADSSHPSSIEEVRKRNQKLAAARLAAGLGEADTSEIPAPWSNSALKWGLGGGLHLAAIWEIAQEKDTLNKGTAGCNADTMGLATALRIVVRPDKEDISLPQRRCPLTITCNHPQQVQHNFTPASPCATISFDVCVRNGAPVGSPRLQFIFEAKAPIGNAGTADKSKKQFPLFALSGCTRVNVDGTGHEGGLEPGNSINFRLNAHFFQPGFYDLNCFRFHTRATTGGALNVHEAELGTDMCNTYTFPSLCFGVNVMAKNET